MRDSEFRFYEDGQYYYFSVPYMTCQMFNKLQEPASDNRTFEQYTGLKDKNGKKIFEGDILQRYKSNGESYKSTKTVSWGYSGFVKVDYVNECQIIGNINEGPTC